jgi:nucleoside triphosphate diphosphatase
MPDAPPTDPRAAAALERLLALLAALRGPQGCSWTLAQTHRSLLPYLLEEAHELAEVVETGPAAPEPAPLREELGDVLYQVLLHARLAEERGAFAFADVAEALAAKLRERHPHVFGGPPLDSPEAVNAAWHARKRIARDSALDGVPPALPALQQAQQVSERAARAGFEWNARGEILAKAAEELEEFRAALAAREAAAGGPTAFEPTAGEPTASAPGAEAGEDAQAELGDLLFALVQLARWQGLDAEAALRGATRKFATRFRWMEKALRARGLRTEAQSAEQWWALWAQAKAAAR